MFTVTSPEAMNETFARAVNSREIANLLALYEEGAVLATGASGSFTSKAAIATELANLLQIPGRMVSRNNFCLRSGDLALLRADWEIVGDDGVLIATGSSAEIVRQQPGGNWLYVIDHAAGGSVPRVA